MQVGIDRVENLGKLVPRQVLDRAIILAQASVAEWTREELELYVFDRLSDEICMRLLGEHDE